MVQLSRPFQAVLGAVALFALVWFFALHRPGSTSTGSGSSSGSSGAQAGGAQSASRATAHPTTASHTAAASHSAGASHGASASHAAAAHAKGAATRTATHTGIATRTGSHTRRTHTVAATAHPGGVAAHKQRAAGHAHGTVAHSRAAAARKAGHTGTITDTSANAIRGKVLQTIVAGDLAHNRMLLLLFWNPRSTNDVAVRRQVAVVAHKLGRSVAAFAARANQVGLFGSITRDVQVYQTPTLLIVNPKQQVTTVTGLTDAYALEQTIREARG